MTFTLHSIRLCSLHRNDLICHLKISVKVLVRRTEDGGRDEGFSLVFSFSLIIPYVVISETAAGERGAACFKQGSLPAGVTDAQVITRKQGGRF